MHVEWVDNEAVVLDPETGTLHYLNPQASLVYALIVEHGATAAINEIEENYGDAAQGDLESLLVDMREKGLLLDD